MNSSSGPAMFESKCNFADVIGIVFNNWTALKVSYRFCISLYLVKLVVSRYSYLHLFSKPALPTIPMIKIIGSLNHLVKHAFGTIETSKFKPMDRILVFKRALKRLKIAICHGFITLLSQKVIAYKPDLFVLYMNISCTGRE